MLNNSFWCYWEYILGWFVNKNKTYLFFTLHGFADSLYWTSLKTWLVHVPGLHYLHQYVFILHCVIMVINLSFHHVKSINLFDWTSVMPQIIFFSNTLWLDIIEIVTLSKGSVQIMDNKQRGLTESRFQNHCTELSECKLEYSNCE